MLLLITDSKSYTGSQLPPNSVTLDDLECQNRGLYGFFGNFGLRDTFQSQFTTSTGDELFSRISINDFERL